MHVLCEFDTICIATNKPLAVDILTRKRTRARARLYLRTPTMNFNQQQHRQLSNVLCSEFAAAAAVELFI